MTEEEKTKTINLTTPIIVILLMAASFLVGLSWNKIREEKEPVVKPEEQKQVVQATPTPKQPVVLGEKEIGQIESGGAGVKGSQDAPITIVEFSEYQCPFCKKYVDEAYARIWEEYGDKTRYIFRDYPLDFHPHSQKLAEATRCAGDQDKYWEMHDLLFVKQDEWANKSDIAANLAGYVKELGLNKTEFDDCLSSGKYTQAVKDDFALGQKMGVSGTPSFFINGHMLVGAQPFANFKAIIEEELGR